MDDGRKYVKGGRVLHFVVAVALWMLIADSCAYNDGNIAMKVNSTYEESPYLASPPRKVPSGAKLLTSSIGCAHYVKKHAKSCGCFSTYIDEFVCSLPFSDPDLNQLIVDECRDVNESFMMRSIGKKENEEPLINTAGAFFSPSLDDKMQKNQRWSEESLALTSILTDDEEVSVSSRSTMFCLEITTVLFTDFDDGGGLITAIHRLQKITLKSANRTQCLHFGRKKLSEAKNSSLIVWTKQGLESGENIFRQNIRFLNIRSSIAKIGESKTENYDLEQHIFRLANGVLLTSSLMHKLHKNSGPKPTEFIPARLKSFLNELVTFTTKIVTWEMTKYTLSTCSSKRLLALPSANKTEDSHNLSNQKSISAALGSILSTDYTKNTDFLSASTSDYGVPDSSLAKAPTQGKGEVGAIHIPPIMPLSGPISVTLFTKFSKFLRTMMMVSFGVIIGIFLSIYILLKNGPIRRTSNLKKRRGRKSLTASGAVHVEVENTRSDERSSQRPAKKLGEDVQAVQTPQSSFRRIKGKDQLEYGDGRWVGSLFVTNNILGYGSHGTLVLEGYLNGRNVAVKRLLGQFYEKAQKEVTALIASDAHANVVRYYATEEDSDFVYVALERCTLNLKDLVIGSSMNSEACYNINPSFSLDNLANLHRIQLRDELCHPSLQLQKLMRDVVEGLAHLHALGYVHRDLKPQNVLICKNHALSAKISDMGISKRIVDGASSIDSRSTGLGSCGWQAPEQLLHQRQTRAVDIFSLGCLLFFCVTGGQHPFGAQFERDRNIICGKADLFAIEHLPEAAHLIALSLERDPKKRPSVAHIRLHPFFWNSEERLSFLRDASDRIELEDKETGSVLLQAIESVADEAVGGSWENQLDVPFLENLGKYRRYNYQSVRDLLRVIRNKSNHFRELPLNLQELLGTIPEGFEGYFRKRFPRLLVEVYKVLYQHCFGEVLFHRYFS